MDDLVLRIREGEFSLKGIDALAYKLHEFVCVREIIAIG